MRSADVRRIFLAGLANPEPCGADLRQRELRLDAERRNYPFHGLDAGEWLSLQPLGYLQRIDDAVSPGNSLADESHTSVELGGLVDGGDRKSTRLNSSHLVISYAVFCLKKKKKSIRSTLEVHNV